MNTYLLVLNNDILNIIGDYVKEDNFKKTIRIRIKKRRIRILHIILFELLLSNDIHINEDETNDKNYYKFVFSPAP
jgi:hypothetical protein